MTHQVDRELMVLASNGNHRAAVSLRVGRVIDILGPAQDTRFVRIAVDGEEFEAFQTDVAERCHLFRSSADEDFNSRKRMRA